MKAAALVAFGSDSLAGKVVAVQGVGNVAYNLCKHLHEEGADLIVTDISEENMNRAVNDFGAKAVGVNEIFSVQSDIFAPCALGAIINDDTIPLLKAKVIAGAANNQLKDETHGDLIYKMGLVYAPDYVINAGGVINVADELQGYNRERALKKVETIYDNIMRVFEISERDGIPSYKAADRMAEERIARMAKSRSTFLRNGKSVYNK